MSVTSTATAGSATATAAYPVSVDSVTVNDPEQPDAMAQGKEAHDAYSETRAIGISGGAKISIDTNNDTLHQGEVSGSSVASVGFLYAHKHVNPRKPVNTPIVISGTRGSDRHNRQH
jgi:hypothetical protein